MRQGSKCQNLVKILTSLQRLLTYLEKFASAVRIGCLPLTIYVFFLYSRKVNDSNDSFNIRTNENSSSRDDIKTPNISDSPSSAELSTDDEIHPRSNEMRFANFEEIRWDYHLFDERRYEKEYTWL